MYSSQGKFFLSLYFFVFVMFSSLQAQVDSTGSLKRDFADFLFSSELYDLAAEEYERVLFYDKTNLEVLKRLIKCYTIVGKDHLLDKRVDLFETEDRSVALSYYDMLISIDQADKLELIYPEQKHLFTASEQREIEFKIAVDNYAWGKAEILYAMGSLQKYGSIMDRIEQGKSKSPGLAAAMSAILPGAGRVYAKDAKDGIISFIFVGSFAYQSYRRFRKNGSDSVGGWIYGGLALGFHISNIYGSYQSAKYYNKKENEKIKEFALPLLVGKS